MKEVKYMKINTNINNYNNPVDLNKSVPPLNLSLLIIKKSRLTRFLSTCIHLFSFDVTYIFFVSICWYHVPSHQPRIPLVQRAWELSQPWSSFTPKISILFPIILYLTYFFNIEQVRIFSFPLLKDLRHNHFETVLL